MDIGVSRFQILQITDIVSFEGTLRIQISLRGIAICGHKQNAIRGRYRTVEGFGGGIINCGTLSNLLVVSVGVFGCKSSFNIHQGFLSRTGPSYDVTDMIVTVLFQVRVFVHSQCCLGALCVHHNEL